MEHLEHACWRHWRQEDASALADDDILHCHHDPTRKKSKRDAFSLNGLLDANVSVAVVDTNHRDPKLGSRSSRFQYCDAHVPNCESLANFQTTRVAD